MSYNRFAYMVVLEKLDKQFLEKIENSNLKLRNLGVLGLGIGNWCISFEKGVKISKYWLKIICF